MLRWPPSDRWVGLRRSRRRNNPSFDSPSSAIDGPDIRIEVKARIEGAYTFTIQSP